MDSKRTDMKYRIIVKPYTLKELAGIYGVGWRTVKAWLEPFIEELGERTTRFYTARQVKIIFDKLGLPYGIEEF